MPTSTQARLQSLLEAAFRPLRLTILDDSARHAGHAGSRPGGGTHFRVEIVSKVFEGKSRLARHHLVNQALAEEFAASLHALSLKALTPAEAGCEAIKAPDSPPPA